MKTYVKVSGLRELNAALRQLPLATQKRVLRRAATAALEPMAQTARDLAPDDLVTPAPDLKTSIAVSSKQKSGRQLRRTKEGPASVIVYMGPTKDGYPEAIMSEFGSGPHVIKPKAGGKLAFGANGDFIVTASPVHHPGNAPHPFMRPAFDQHKVEAIASVGREVGGEIMKAAKRLARKAARRGA